MYMVVYQERGWPRQLVAPESGVPRSRPLELAQDLGRALMQLGHDEEAIDALRQAMDTAYLRGKAWLAAAKALAGDIERARLHLAEYIALEPGMTVRRFAAQQSSVPIHSASQVYRRESERILEGLRKAGMPEE
jgi:predicted Zn-dependent protease